MCIVIFYDINYRGKWENWNNNFLYSICKFYKIECYEDVISKVNENKKKNESSLKIKNAIKRIDYIL